VTVAIHHARSRINRNLMNMLFTKSSPATPLLQSKSDRVLRPLTLAPLIGLFLLSAIGCRQAAVSSATATGGNTQAGSGPQTGGGTGSRGNAGGPSSTASTAGDNLALGNPSNATADKGNADNYLLTRPQYTLSYNRSNGGPNWVSWHVQLSDLGRVPRSNNFAPDPLLPPDWQIRPNDYTGSGYDRGHQCPSGDRTSSVENNSATFYMSNMLPQSGDLNRHVWEKLEAYCRDRVQAGNELYIVAGGSGSKGKARNKVNIPTDCWKVVVELPQGDNDLNRINANTRVIAVDMPNVEGIAGDRWQKYITTAADVEQKTGYHFFSNLPANVQSALRAKKDAGRAASGDDSGSQGRNTNSQRSTRASRRRHYSNSSTPTDSRAIPDAESIPTTSHHRTRSVTPQTAPSQDAGGAPRVWVNTKSGVYHYPGQRWYGATVEGQYMTEAEAIQHGYRANTNGQ